MNYRQAAIEFIDIAFKLLYLHEYNPTSTYCRGTMLLCSTPHGKPNYIMNIGEHGRLNVIDTRKKPGHQIVTHSGPIRDLTQTMLSVPNMLRTYLEILQKENEG